VKCEALKPQKSANVMNVMRFPISPGTFGKGAAWAHDLLTDTMMTADAWQLGSVI